MHTLVQQQMQYLSEEYNAIRERAENTVLGLALSIMQDDPELAIFYMGYGSWGFTTQDGEDTSDDVMDDFMSTWIGVFDLAQNSLTLDSNGTLINDSLDAEEEVDNA